MTIQEPLQKRHDITLNIRIRELLARFLKEKDHQSQLCWLYIELRKQGQRVWYRWIDCQENDLTSVDLLPQSPSEHCDLCQIEFLSNPMVRTLRFSGGKQQWNVHRGVKGAIYRTGDVVSRWSALQMIANNMDFVCVARRHLRKTGGSEARIESVPVTLYDTHQLHLPLKGKLRSRPMFRGNRLVRLGDVNEDSLKTATSAMTRWLVDQVDVNGACQYKYWPSQNRYSQSNNPIRQWMATVCLGRAASFYGDEGIRVIAEQNISHNLATMFVREGELGYVQMDGYAKLGSAAMAGLALVESDTGLKYRETENALYQFTRTLQQDDGSFHTFWIPKGRTDFQNFYSGETLLYWVARYQKDRDDRTLKAVEVAFLYYRDWHRKQRNPAFVPWHTQALYILWQITEDERYKDFIFEMNDWLLSMQQIKTAPYQDMSGRFYDPLRPYYGPPHASSTGVYLEGLVDAWKLATALGDEKRVFDYAQAIKYGVRSIFQLIFRGDSDSFYVDDKRRVIGGVRTTEYDNSIRIDNVQHPLMALVKLTRALSQLGRSNDFWLV